MKKKIKCCKCGKGKKNDSVLKSVLLLTFGSAVIYAVGAIFIDDKKLRRVLVSLSGLAAGQGIAELLFRRGDND